MSNDSKIVVAPKYEPLFRNNDCRYCLITGGRGSGKSFAVGLFSVVALMQNEWQRVLYTRYTLTSAHISIVPEFAEKIEMLGAYDNFSIAQNIITYKPNGNSVWFRGIQTARGSLTANLKSLQGITTWIIEEAEELVDEETFDRINFSIRDNRSRNRVIIVMNPLTKNHWVYNRFFAEPNVPYNFNGVANNCCYIHSTYLDNTAHLSPDYIKEISALSESNPEKYRHTIMGEWADDYEGALWKRDWIKQNRILHQPELDRIVIGLDPSVSGDVNSDECGIIVAGKRRNDDKFYILEDLTVRDTPSGWAKAVARAYSKYEADAVIAETNQGGDMVKEVLSSAKAHMNVRMVHAVRGKQARAEPIAALYENGNVAHVGRLNDLEDELCTWVPDSGMKSPNRLDALCYALHYLMENREVSRVSIGGMF